MRQVLLEALMICQTKENDITEHLGNSDDYIGLKISADAIIMEDTLDLYYTFGALCAIFLIKTHSAPEPVSPALIQAAIGGIDSVLDPKWIASISPALAKILSLLPANPEAEIPNHPVLRAFIEARLINSRVCLSLFHSIKSLFITRFFKFDSVRRSPPAQRAGIIRMLTVSALLGSSERILQESPEFAAFSNGLNLYLTPTYPSFKEVSLVFHVELNIFCKYLTKRSQP